jgi:translation initiation factor IF-2
MDASASTAAKQNIRRLKKEKAEALSTAPDRKKLKKIQRQIRVLKRQTRRLANEKKAAAAKAAAEAAAKEAAEKAAAAAAKRAEASASAG